MVSSPNCDGLFAPAPTTKGALKEIKKTGWKEEAADFISPA